MVCCLANVKVVTLFSLTVEDDLDDVEEKAPATSNDEKIVTPSLPAKPSPRYRKKVSTYYSNNPLIISLESQLLKAKHSYTSNGFKR